MVKYLFSSLTIGCRIYLMIFFHEETCGVRIGVGFKLSVLSCFCVLFMNVLELGFKGGALIWGEANGDADVDLSLNVVTAAQGLAWFVLSFSPLYCKFKVLERFPFLLTAWWFLSFVICLCTLYVDGRGFWEEGS